jgi:hypothetical protein
MLLPITVLPIQVGPIGCLHFVFCPLLFTPDTWSGNFLVLGCFELCDSEHIQVFQSTCRNFGGNMYMCVYTHTYMECR